MYKIGEEVIVVRNFKSGSYHLKKGTVVESDLGTATVKFSDDVVNSLGETGPTAIFYHMHIANAKEFLQLQLEGKIE